jgi:Putative lumazine-binding
MKTENESIRKLVIDYVSAVDAQNVQEAGRYLEANFRVVLNNYKNLPEPALLSKEQYLTMMGEGKVGGNERSVSFEFIDSNLSVAIAKVILESESNVFRTYYHLIKKPSGWFILSDTPEIASK